MPIRQTRFFETRILPLPDSVVVELRAYVDARRRAGGSQDARSGLFWHERGESHYMPEMITWLLTDLITPHWAEAIARKNRSRRS